MVAKAKKKPAKVLGIDLGNGMVTIRAVDKKGKPYILTLPSCYAYKRNVGDSVQGEGLELDTYVIDGEEYVWGKDISEIKKLELARGYENRYKSEAYKVMVKIALAKVVNDLGITATDDIFVVTGVPSDEANNIKIENDIQLAFFGGEGTGGLHEVTVNGVLHRFLVKEVDVLSQPLATVIGRYLDENGYVNEEIKKIGVNYEEWKVVVIDIGAGTTDIDIIDHLRRLSTHVSIPRGFSDVYESIRTEIKRHYPSHEVSDYKLLKLLDVKKYKPSRLKEEVDFTDAFNKGINEVLSSIQQAILGLLKDMTDLDEVLLVGASANHFEDKISNIMYGIEIPENHPTSNAEGYFRWGMYKSLQD